MTTGGSGGDYKTGRLLARLISFFGWLIICISTLIYALWVVGPEYSGVVASEYNLYGSAFAYTNTAILGTFLIGLFIGMFLIATGHMMRATMDTANATREMLRILKS